MKKIGILILAFSILLLTACSQKEAETTIAETETTTAEAVDFSSLEPEELLAALKEDSTLTKFLHVFEYAYTKSNADADVDYEYDYKTTKDGDYTILTKIIGHPTCVSWVTYPVSEMESVWEDEDLEPFANYNMAAEADVAWIAKNIFHADDAAMEACQKLAFKDVTSSNMLYFEDGKYVIGINNYEGAASDMELLSAEEKDGLYYISYEFKQADPSGVTYNDDLTRTIYVVLGKENIDGTDYWTMYTHSSKDFIEP